MKLQKQKVKKAKDKDYFKYVIIIPSKQVEELGWIEGMKLESIILDGNIILKPIELNKKE
jgi:bifunctional DNA-binding transcriptional regulator/antitoxin component of YhaV-PrlF toxin-antitoxin module